MLQEIITLILLLLGTLFILVAALGLLRMPDLYTRMSASAKANTLGISLILLAALIHFPGAATKGIALVVILFMFLSTPVGAHMIARAAYLVGVPLWKRTLVDELRGHYDSPGPSAGRQPDQPPPGQHHQPPDSTEP